MENSQNQNLQDVKMNRIMEKKSSKSSNSENPASDKWEIPSDWEVKKFDDFAPLQRGFDLPVEKIISGDFPVVFSNGILKHHKEFKAKAPGVVTGRSGTIGKVTFVENDYWPHNTSLWVTDFKGNYPKYVYYFLIFLELDRFGSGSGVPTLNRNDVHRLKIPLPPLPEQKAIAAVLSTWDAAISKTQALIAQKELRKKWLMQNLLTGKMRLKGFEGEWKEKRLKDVTTNFSRRNKDLIDAKVFSVTNKSGFVLQSEHFEGKVAGEDLSNYKIIKRNEFAYNPARINVGSLAYFEGEVGVISSLYVCFKTTKDVLDYFLLQFLQIDHTKHRIEALGEGGVRVYLWYDLFSKIKIKIPSYEEQTAIAQVLQAADKEIQLLKSKMEKLKEQKKGLMQVLLTGKKRLNQDLQDLEINRINATENNF